MKAARRREREKIEVSVSVCDGGGGCAECCDGKQTNLDFVLGDGQHGAVVEDGEEHAADGREVPIVGQGKDTERQHDTHAHGDRVHAVVLYMHAHKKGLEVFRLLSVVCGVCVCVLCCACVRAVTGVPRRSHEDGWRSSP